MYACYYVLRAHVSQNHSDFTAQFCTLSTIINGWQGSGTKFNLRERESDREEKREESACDRKRGGVGRGGLSEKNNL